MITEDYVNFEIAKLLKEKGFDESTSHAYSNNGELLRLCDYGIRDLTNTECNDYLEWQFPIEDVNTIISAPTLQMAMKWLRKQHNLYVKVEIGEDEGSFWYDFDVIPIGGNAIVPEDDEISIYYEPEEALEAGIKYALENLI